jgi:hypothetical protein
MKASWDRTIGVGRTRARRINCFIETEWDCARFPGGDVTIEQIFVASFELTLEEAFKFRIPWRCLAVQNGGVILCITCLLTENLNQRNEVGWILCNLLGYVNHVVGGSLLSAHIGGGK